MRLPRRVPWAHIGELEQVCSCIYADEEDLEAKAIAIDRLSAWKAITPLPHALDSALAMLAARMLDVTCGDITSAKNTLSLRQAYATAIIRMVNGLVDPLQSGVYARSMATIATQLGLPSWLVELRHAATHEDLPSLELLREAARESLSWLLRNYFDPTLNPSAPSSISSLSLRPIAPLLKSYKLLMKTVARDWSLRQQHQNEIDAVMRDIERWIAETKVSAELAVHPLGWGFEDNSVVARAETREKWALEIVCSALFERGAIVPVSKRKCRAPADPFLPTTASLALWAPLLRQLHASHNTFPSIFINRIVAILLDDLVRSNEDIIEPVSGSLRIDTTYSEYLARWVVWAARTWTAESENGTDLRKEVVLQLAPAFIPGQNSGLQAKFLNELLLAVSVGSQDLEACVGLLRSTVAVVPTKLWKTNDLVNMEERFQMLMADEFQTPDLSGNSTTTRNGAAQSGGISAAGWRLLDGHSNWTPCPIGVYRSNR